MTTTKTAVITGANTGLGFECARALLNSDPGWHVLLAVRDTGRGAAAAAALGNSGRTTVAELDLASLRSVNEFACTTKQLDMPPIRALVCNAGVQVVSGSHTTRDGYEMTFGVNHLGHFAVVRRLLDQLVAPARIVVVSSGTHDPDRYTGMPAPRYTSAEQLCSPEAGGQSSEEGRRRYTTSKLCNVLFSYELDRRLGHGAAGVTVNAFDPGMMPGSGLARDYPPAQRLAWRFVLPVLRVLPGVRSTRRSGADLAALVADPRYDGVTGAYFDGTRRVRSSRDSYDESLAADLWRVSDRLVSAAG
ncbi:SDR family NAD(P)-dependent oxidoreductase [Mycobacterium aquaticum]|uniref:Alanine-phosphoribitol ligase n=1 Tax=Mycobacterium aquaticum TaxID=1927124 RepID=A0A1X0ATY3_9MYCO|nr:SDR family NAD(P)-dependent oxidoreductase [Mycobacterium aquaticum]ORA33503.1 alanine-phosphoribitol ligase [Mycobacterium aquaticum]